MVVYSVKNVQSVKQEKGVEKTKYNGRFSGQNPQAVEPRYRIGMTRIERRLAGIR